MTALIGIASNKDATRNIRQALDALDQHPDCRVAAVSRFFSNPARDADGNPSGAAAYVNGAALLETDLDVEALKTLLKEIEAACGRTRANAEAGVTVDLDLVMLKGTSQAERANAATPGRACQTLFCHSGRADCRRLDHTGPNSDICRIGPHYRYTGTGVCPTMKSSPLLDSLLAESLHNGHVKSNGTNGHGPTNNHATLDPATPKTAVHDAELEAMIERILVRVGEDPARDGLVRTPLRVARALDELTVGYRTDVADVVNDAIFEDDGEEMVLVKDIEFYSLCEHHMLPFYGKVHIAYVPDGKIIGLSKLARIADVFARRLQVQERLTNQIADALEELLAPRGVAVMAEAAHFCMMMRGVQKQNSTTVTTAMRGVFKTDKELRREFMSTVRGS